MIMLQDITRQYYDTRFTIPVIDIMSFFIEHDFIQIYEKDSRYNVEVKDKLFMEFKKIHNKSGNVAIALSYPKIKLGGTNESAEQIPRIHEYSQPH